MPFDYDAIIVGSGAGGGTIAWKLCTAGKRVLLIERGKRFDDPTAFQNEKRMLIDMEAFDDRTFRVNERDTRLYIGGVLGGGTALYGSALLRPSRDDFHPGKFYSKWLEPELWDWPINYDDLEPYYDQVEELLGVTGDVSATMLHIEKPRGDYTSPPPELEPINKKLKRGIEESGFHPFHLPLGIDFNRCLRCPTCPGFYCPNNARASTTDRFIERAIATNNLELRTEFEAERILLDQKGKGRGIRVRSRHQNVVEELTAENYIISAGAIGSPVLLMKSGYEDRSGELGRNYAYHCGALVAGIFREPTGGSERFIKQLGFTDLYFGNNEFPHKLGYVQTLPSPGPLSVQENAPLPIPHSLAKFLNRRMLIISGAVEDLPQQENRVHVDRSGKIHLTHKFHPYDIERSRWYLQQLKRVMKKTGALFTFGATGEKDDRHTAHQTGTVRFGTDPKQAVLDSNCRLHGYENVYVVDGSFTPTSLGVGPALTIMANALRVGEIIATP
ncbi:MAG: GMC family oxidoreductase [Ignavibacteriae bacterium]|nr:GMC family oxidoreductase [Ignavibacteriota bacterium]MCB9214655.1 GMC family oxidoreductase [Ignavibacteria bacterium]